jgi:hypothetical protein
MLIRMSLRWRLAAYLTLGVAIAACIVGWIAWQDHLYSEQTSQVEQEIQRHFVQLPTGLDKKFAILATDDAAVTKTVRISLLIHRSLMQEPFRDELRRWKTIDAPPRWRDYQRARVESVSAEVRAFDAMVDADAYAERVLGDHPDDRRLVQLANDDHFRALREASDAAWSELPHAARRRDAALPAFAQWMPGSPAHRWGSPYGTRTRQFDDLDREAGCAAARLAHVTPTAKCAEEHGPRSTPRCRPSYSAPSDDPALTASPRSSDGTTAGRACGT